MMLPLAVIEGDDILTHAFFTKDLMKGYIARERGFVVLSKKGAFPGTGV
jgi:COP9 signalosome complex subunit 12